MSLAFVPYDDDGDARERRRPLRAVGRAMSMAAGGVGSVMRGRAGPTLSRLIGCVLVIGLGAVAVSALSHLLGGIGLADIRAAIVAIPAETLTLALAYCVLSYIALTGYDWFAVSHVGLDVPYRRAAFASFLSYGFANSIGFALLTGGTLRCRIYGGAGASAGKVAIVTAICGLTFALAGSLVVGVSMLLAPGVIALAVPLPPLLIATIGGTMLALLAAYLVWVSIRPRAMTRGGVTFTLPRASATLAQLGVGAADIICAGLALYVLLPATPAIGLFGFLGLFAAAITLGYLSHVPGGVGVFKSLIVLALPDIAPGALIASLIAYRCLYYVLPLLLSVALFGGYELRRSMLARPLRV